MKKILITGANGDIGSQISLFLQVKNIPTINLVRDSSEKINGRENIQQNSLFEINKLHDLIKQTTDIIHLAGILNNCCINKFDYANMLCINSLFTAIIVAIANKCKCKKRFIYMSSEMVYQIDNDLVNDWITKATIEFEGFCANKMQDENICNINSYKTCIEFCMLFLEKNPVPDNVNFYSLTKLLAEKFVSKIDNSVILRLTNIYGPGYVKNRKIPRLIKAKLFGNCINEDNDIRDYVYVLDINEVLFKLIHTNNYNINETFDLASMNRILSSDVVDIINTCLPIQYGEVELTRSESIVPKREYAKNIFDVLKISPFNFISGIQETIKFFQATIDYRKKMNYYSNIEDLIRPDEKIIKMFRGGSASCTMLIQDAESQKYVRKVALREGVEGNGIPKLRKEIEYLRYIEQYEPNLYEYYSTLRNSIFNEDLACYDMDYIGDGTNMFETLKNHLSEDLFFSYFKEFIDGIIENGYIKKIKVISMSESQEIFKSLITNRALGRLESLFNYYKSEENIEKLLSNDDKFLKNIIEKLQNEYIIINEKTYQNPILILRKITLNLDLVSLFQSHIKSMCAHGDLTLMNMVWDNKNKTIRLIDPRGLIGELDPMYDFGKIKFSLSGFSCIMEGSYEIALDKSSNFIFKTTYSQDIKNKFKEVNSGFIQFLSELGTFKKLTSLEFNWRKRILIYEAIHYFADIPFRLYTDGNPRNAIACFLRGTVLLNDLYNSLIE